MTEPTTERRLSETRAIPTRRVQISDERQMPSDYSTTPGGTLFSTTPGGTRIIYDRQFLMQCRNSPLAKSPPNLPKIPGVTSPDVSADPKANGEVDAKGDVPNAEEPQFEMDI